jgi:predicted lipoprotein with Yx(FWY)xxD motif
MRKSGWAAATGLGSLVLLLAACGGSSSSSNAAAGASSSTAHASAAASTSTGTAAAQSTSSGPASPSSNPATGATSPQGSSSSSYQAAGAQPTSGSYSFPPQGTTFMVVAKTAIGYVLAEASGQVVYTYAKDAKDGAPTCTGSCAATWPPVTGTPKAGAGDTFPGRFGVVRGAGGVEQVTYNGYPLYTLQGADSHSVAGNGSGGVWRVIPLSASDIG